MEISIERSPQHWCPSAGFELTTVGPEFDTLDRSATDPHGWLVGWSVLVGLGWLVLVGLGLKYIYKQLSIYCIYIYVGECHILGKGLFDFLKDFLGEASKRGLFVILEDFDSLKKHTMHLPN